MLKVDLNADMGESFGAYQIGSDQALAQYISSANVACGFHAADPNVMAKTVDLLVKEEVAIGAHPGLNDLIGFGRRPMSITPTEAKNDVLYQLGALSAFAKAKGKTLHHVKPHGALYNMAAQNAELAMAIAEAVASFDDNLVFLGLSGSEMLKAAKACGLRVASEVFADRAYTDEGLLVNRKLPGAMIENPDDAINRVIQMIKEGTVTSINGNVIPIEADSICIHGDGPNALTFAKQIHQRLIAEGIQIVSLQNLI